MAAALPPRGLTPPVKPVVKVPATPVVSEAEVTTPNLKLEPPVPAITLVKAWWNRVVAEAPAAHHRDFREYAAERFHELEEALLDR